MWNFIRFMVTALNTFVDIDTLPVPAPPKKRIPSLMEVLVQPTDAYTASVPLLWEYKARSFDDLFYKMTLQVPPPVMTQRVFVTKPPLPDVPLRDACPVPLPLQPPPGFPAVPLQDARPFPLHRPPPGFGYTEAGPPSPLLVSSPRDVPLSLSTCPLFSTELPAVSPSAPILPPVPVRSPPVTAVTSTAPAVDLPTTPPDIDLEPNPWSGRVPHIDAWFDNGRGSKPVVYGTGGGRSCHICGIVSPIKISSSHSESEGHEGHKYESMRQEAWYHKCLVCDIMCTGYSNFRDHIVGKRHKKKVKIGLWPEKRGYCMGRPACLLDCCK